MLVSVLIFVQRTFRNTWVVSDAARSEAETKAVEINGVMQKQSIRDQITSRETILPYEVRCLVPSFGGLAVLMVLACGEAISCSQVFLFL